MDYPQRVEAGMPMPDAQIVCSHMSKILTPIGRATALQASTGCNPVQSA
jgi:hypothetical protein